MGNKTVEKLQKKFLARLRRLRGCTQPKEQALMRKRIEAIRTELEKMGVTPGDA